LSRKTLEDKRSPRRIKFKGKHIRLKFFPRKGECEKCHKRIGDRFINRFGSVDIIKRTHIHHIKYHADDPLRDTIELCIPCHRKEHLKN
jgi:hypothetical protein